MLDKQHIFALFIGYGSIFALLWCLKKFNSLREFLTWVSWEFSGLRFVYEKVWPPSPNVREQRKSPPTFVIWVVGIYVALYGLAYQRFENARNMLELKTNAVIGQLATQTWRMTLNRIPKLQNSKIPVNPDFLNPISIYTSMFGEGIADIENVELLISVLEAWKDSLHGLDLTNANLTGANLREANLENTILIGANLNRADLFQANLKKSLLVNASFVDAMLDKANLEKAGITGCNFSGASLIETKLIDIVTPTTDERFEKKYKSGSKNVLLTNDYVPPGGINSENCRLLCNALTLYNAEMSESLNRLIKSKCPDVLGNSPFPKKMENFRIRIQ
ncbi:uncharacterized protein Dvar_56580 [Desulfosarcina variabilis str. Montpellier]|uniref:pentapeptide repeat-containing protein n=1 Tax=Desulfosarcina variabilis TaxID=2300 RepID=UPI003AFA5E46